jgi:glycosyltransferase involved in cell wall biosynthesis
VINSVRGSDLHTHIFNPKNHGQMSWILANSNWVNFVSRDLQRRAIALVPDIRDRCSAFWNSIVPIEFDHLPKPALLNELSGVVIGSTGRFRGKKGMENLLDACTDLSAEVDITLLLVGDFVEKERDYWQQELATCPLGDRLRITGIVSREQALAYLPYLDIFAIPSLHDGCPNAMLEAMLAGCPIVGAKVDAIGEILADGVAGLMVEPGNTEDLKSALKQLATNPQQRQTLSQGSREKVLTDLAPDVERANWLNVYHHAFSA